MKETALSRHAVFSVGEEDGILRYEKELSEHMWEIGTYKHIKVSEDEIHMRRANLAQCFVKGKEVLITYETKDGMKAVLYNLATGEDSEYSKKDKKWNEEYEDMEVLGDDTTYFLTMFLSDGFEDDVVYEE